MSLTFFLITFNCLHLQREISRERPPEREREREREREVVGLLQYLGAVHYKPVRAYTLRMYVSVHTYVHMHACTHAHTNAHACMHMHI